jgi:polysaccharide pyruvyl transferase WcaK-like protein
VNVTGRKRLYPLTPALFNLSKSGRELGTLQSMNTVRGAAPDATVPQSDRLDSYSFVDEFATAIGRYQLVLTNKLHVGVTALSFGVPFLSLRGRPKTQTFLREFGLGRASLSRPEIQLFSTQDLHHRIAAVQEWLITAQPRLAADARGHFEVLADAIGRA